MSWCRLVLLAWFAAVLGGGSLAGPSRSNNFPSRMKGREGPSFLVHRCNVGRAKTVVCIGKVFRPGEFDDRLLSLEFRAGGKRIVPQLGVLQRHPDQTVRLARFSLPLRVVHGKVERLKTRFVPKADVSQVSGFQVEETADGLRLSDGVINLVATRNGQICFRDLKIGSASESALESMSLGFSPDDAELEIEEIGPYLLIVKQSGRVAVDDQEVGHPFVRRLIMMAGSAQLRTETWITSSSMASPGGAFQFAMELGFEARRLRLAGDSEDLEVLETGLDIDRFGRSIAPEITSTWAEEGLLLQGSKLSLRIEVEDLLERGPGTVRLEERSLRLPMSSADYRWRTGRSASRRIDISLKSGGRSTPPRAARLAVVELESRSKSKVVAIWSEAQEVLTARLKAALQPQARRDSGLDWRGELNWGDWRWSRTDAGNLEYDTILGLRHAAQYLEQPELLLRSRQAMKHFLRVDLNAVGIPWRHGPGHVGGVEAGHMWLQGAIQEAISDADPFLIEGLVRVVSAWSKGLKRFRPERELCRSLAWTLILATSLVRDWAETGLETEVSEIYRSIASAPGGSVPLFDRCKKEKKDDPITYYVSAWVNLGLLGEAIHEGLDLPGRAGAESRWRQATQALLPRIWNEELAYPAARFVYDEEGALLRQGGRMEGEEALILALGLSRADNPGGEEAALMALLFPYAFENLRLASKTFNGIEVSQMMWLMARL